MEFTVNDKKFTDYNEAKAYEDSLKQKEAEAKKQKALEEQKELYFDEVVNKMSFCVVNFDNEKITSPTHSVVFAFMTDTPKNKSDFVTMANAYIEEACEKRFYVDEDGSYGEYYSIAFPTVKSKGYDELSSCVCGSIIDYLLNHGHAFSTSGNLIKIDKDLSVMFYDLTGVDKQNNKTCDNCSVKKNCDYDELPDDIKVALDFIGRLFG